MNMGFISAYKVIFTSILGLCLSIVIGCKKYEEGPKLSFRSRAARVAGTWQVESVSINGTDITDTYKNVAYTETYDKEGNYGYSENKLGYATSYAGTWDFKAKDEQIERKTGTVITTLTITRLKQKEFWYFYYVGNDKYEFRMKSSK